MAVGYVHASDRLSQMTGFRLMPRAALQKWQAIPCSYWDVYMRTLGSNALPQPCSPPYPPGTGSFWTANCEG
jgi:hypothetical protein